MIRTTLAGLTLGIAATLATFIPMIRTLSPIEREWVRTMPKLRT